MTVSGVLRNLAALAVSLIIGVIGIEGLVRLSGRDVPLVWRPDPVLGWWHAPGARMHYTDEGDGQVQINRAGMRDVERTPAKPAGVFRIAVFGDSMTEGVQVNLDQTYTQQLERRLTARGQRVEVLNFGVNGYSPLQDYLLYRKVGKSFDPDLVVAAIFTDNDIADGMRELATGQAGGPILRRGDGTIDFSPAEESARDYAREPVHSVREWSAIYRLLSRARNQSSTENRAAASTSAGGGIPKRFMLYAQPTPPAWDEAWGVFETVLTKFQAEVAADHRAFVVLSVPAGQVVDSGAWSTQLARFSAMARQSWKLTAAEDRLRDVAARHGISVVAPLEAFRASLGSEPLFIGGIGHFTGRGHAVMAEAMDKTLTALGLLPR